MVKRCFGGPGCLLPESLGVRGKRADVHGDQNRVVLDVDGLDLFQRCLLAGYDG